MKKIASFLMIALLAAMLTGALFADVVTSYDRNKPLVNPSTSQLLEIKAIAAQTGQLTQYERQALQSSETAYVAQPIQRSRLDFTANPQAVNYWTGTTEGTSFTDVSEVRGWNLEDGWFMFDISGIPAGATITGVQFNGYVNYTNWPYWVMTPLDCNPLTTDADSLYADITAEEGSGYYIYQQETSSYTTGWKQYDLGTDAVTDLQAALTNGWWACGMASTDNSSAYYINWDGWNETNPPYLVISYDAPIVGTALASGTISPTSGNTLTNFTYTVLYANGEGDAPMITNVYIDGVAHTMTGPGGTPDWTQWQTFTYTTTLPAGTHEYYFYFTGGTTSAYYPSTAPTTPFTAPTVYAPLNTTLTIDPSGSGDYTTIQDCFDALMLNGVSAPTDVTVLAGTYGAATLNAIIPGASSTNMVYFHSSGEVIVDALSASTAPIYVLNSGNVWFDGFTLINGTNSGARFETTDYCKISNSVIYNNSWMGICYTTGSTNGWAWNNFLYNNYTQQIALYDCGTGCNINIWNNSIYACSAYTGYLIAITVSNTEANIYNNAMHRNWATGSGYSILHYQNQDWTSHPNTFFDYNDYYTEDGCAVVTGYTTLADWQASGNGQDMNSVYGSPSFNDFSTVNLHISGFNALATVCFEAGTGTGAWFTDDIDGDTRSAWDIGADFIVQPSDPGAGNGDVSPSIGLTTDTFTYTVDLNNPLGTTVNSAVVYIDGSATGLALVYPADPNNGTYTLDRLGSDIGTGTHTYYFVFDIAGYGTLTYPASGTLSGPEVLPLPEVPYNESFTDQIMSYWTLTTSTYSNVYWSAAANNGSRTEGGAVMVGGSSSTGWTTPTTANVWTLAADGGSNATHSAYMQVHVIYDGAPADMIMMFDYSLFYQYNNMYTNMRVDINTGSGWTQVGSDYRPAGANTGWLNSLLSLGTISDDFDIRFWTSCKYNLTGYTNGAYIDNIYVGPPPAYMMNASIDATAKNGFCSSTTTYTVTINNTGTQNDTYTLGVSGNSWPTVWDAGSSISVASGATETTTVTVTCPAAAGTDTAQLTIVSQNDASVYATLAATTTAYANYRGPDAYGYTAATNYQPGGPSYEWITPVGRTAMTLPADDTYVGPFDIGFSFPFYTNTYTQFYFGSNGYISFGAGYSTASGIIPNTSTPNNIVAWFWDDLDPYDNPDGDTYIYYETRTVDDMNAMVLTMLNYHEYAGGGTGKLTAQVILFENGNIKMQYQSFDGGIVMSMATVGIENADGSTGIAYENDLNLLVPGMAIMYYSPSVGPEAPEVTITMSGADAVLTWDLVFPAQQYHVYYATDPNGTWSLLDSTTASTYTHTGAGASVTKYYYKVTADTQAPTR